MIDVDEFRRMAFPGPRPKGLDEAYTFYSDETNNIRKLRIDADGLNVAEPKVFALGGVLHRGTPRPLDITAVRQAMRIQPSAPEIKLEHVATGDFLSALQSPKLTVFLQWLADSDLLVHYLELDPLFWSFTDIVDSVLAARDDFRHLPPGHMTLKSDLVALLRADLPATVRLLHAHGYPGLQSGDRRPFMTDLLELIGRHEHLIEHFNFMMVRGVLQAGRSADALAFIEDNPRHLLIEEFSGFYRTRVILFKNAKHVFDEEKSIQQTFSATPLTSGGAPFVNYRFVDSKKEPGIQVSDVVIGLLGKMHSYFVATPRAEIVAARDALSGTALTNATLLRDLISASHDACMVFQHHIASMHDIEKADCFLRYSDGTTSRAS